jgi:hypothetical protein
MGHILRLRSEWAALLKPRDSSFPNTEQPPLTRVPEGWELQDAAFDAGFAMLSASLDQRRREAAKDEALWGCIQRREGRPPNTLGAPLRRSTVGAVGTRGRTA